MAEDLQLQHPHVHHWKRQDTGRAYRGPVEPQAPAIFCDCGEATGRWDQVRVWFEVETQVELTVEEIWPDGDFPKPVTAAAIKEFMTKRGVHAVVDDLDLLMDYEVNVSLARGDWARVH